MALHLRTTRNSEAFMEKILRGIRTDESIKTWAIDRDGFLYHTPSDWSNQGRFEPKVDADGDVSFYLRKPKGSAYPYLHGRLVEMLMSHFVQKGDQLLIVDRRT